MSWWATVLLVVLMWLPLGWVNFEICRRWLLGEHAEGIKKKIILAGTAGLVFQVVVDIFVFACYARLLYIRRPAAPEECRSIIADRGGGGSVK